MKLGYDLKRCNRRITCKELVRTWAHKQIRGIMSTLCFTLFISSCFGISGVSCSLALQGFQLATRHVLEWSLQGLLSQAAPASLSSHPASTRSCQLSSPSPRCNAFQKKVVKGSSSEHQVRHTMGICGRLTDAVVQIFTTSATTPYREFLRLAVGLRARPLTTWIWGLASTFELSRFAVEVFKELSLFYRM